MAELEKLVVHLQLKSAPFSSLVKIFGSGMTLGQLSDLETQEVIPVTSA